LGKVGDAKHGLRKKRFLFLICIGFLLGFLLLTFFRGSLLSADLTVNIWVPSIQSSAATFLADGVALIFDTTSLVLISLVISGLLLLKGFKAQSLLLLAAMGGDALFVSTLKSLEPVSRPTNGLLLDGGFSYPSGHSAGCIVFAGVLVFFAWRRWQSTRSRAMMGVGLGVVVGVVGFDRVYLGVHWLSDVFGGWLFGGFWLSLALLVYVWLERAGKFSSKRFGVVANWLFVAALVVALWVVASGYVQ
jgi:membrane-associated phospholipid phosphatase